MLGWGIITAVFVVGLIISIRWDHKRKKDGYSWDEGNIVITGIISIILFILILNILISPLDVKEQVNEFELLQEMVEVTYSESEEELNFAMNIQILEMNKWLAEARASEETYGIFSFYSGRIDDLEYIEIGD